MFIQAINNSHPGRRVTKPQYLLSLFIVVASVLAIQPTKAHAELTGDLEVKIPFQFYAGNAKLPAGEYRLHPLDDSDLSLVEISSADGSTSAIFQVQNTDANPNVSPDGELVFNKYGDRYFLTKLFEGGSSEGSKVVESRYEKTVSQQTVVAQEHVPAHHRKQNGK